MLSGVPIKHQTTLLGQIVVLLDGLGGLSALSKVKFTKHEPSC